MEEREGNRFKYQVSLLATVVCLLLAMVLSAVTPSVKGDVFGEVETDEELYYEWERVIFTYSCSSDSGHIIKVMLHAKYESSQEELYKDTFFPSSGAVSVSGSSSFVVPDTGIFELGVFCLDTDDNTIYTTTHATVLAREPPPDYGPPTVWTGESKYYEGDTITVLWECPFEVREAHVFASVSGVILHDRTYSYETEGEASFTATISGIVKYSVACIDSSGNAWANKEQVAIHEVIQNGGDGNANGSEISFGSILVLIVIPLIVIAVVVAVILAIVLRQRAKQPPTQ